MQTCVRSLELILEFDDSKQHNALEIADFEKRLPLAWELLKKSDERERALNGSKSEPGEIYSENDSWIKNFFESLWKSASQAIRF